jgi:hypothetical protein
LENTTTSAASAAASATASLTASAAVCSVSNVAFDQETGFPLNADTEKWVSLVWRGGLASQAPLPGSPQMYSTFRVPYAVLDAATSGFSQACCIGGGGSCAVYMAVVYGTTVAVKALNTMLPVVPPQAPVGTLAAAAAAAAEAGGGASSSNKRRLESEARQFAAEHSLLTTVQHPNICRLLGVSADGPRRCLVLEHSARAGAWTSA